jgi:hypothetical protein
LREKDFNIKENMENTDNLKGEVMVYRYNFSNEFNAILYEFAKIHQYDDRKQFKEAWIVWKEENNDFIEKEISRLREMKYNGDVLDKMFKSARYYFRKKSIVRPEPKERRQYHSVEKKMLDTMDRYIRENLGIRPSDSFNNFCENCKEDLKDEVCHLVGVGLEKNEIINKIKKTYKNRYFMLVAK